MTKSNGHSNSSVPTTEESINGVEWEFSTKYHERKTLGNVDLRILTGRKHQK